MDKRNASEIRDALLPSDPRWLDHSGLGPIALVLTPGAGADQALEQAFWNRSVKSFLLLPGTPAPDVFGVEQLSVDRAGRLLAGGRPVRMPVAVQNHAVTVRLAAAAPVARGGGFELWRPAGVARLSLLALGRYHDGWLATNGQIGLWPGRSGRTRGTLRLRLSLPAEAPTLTLRFRGGGVARDVALDPGSTRTVAFRVEASGPWAVSFTSSAHGVLADGRTVSVRAAVPVFSRS